MGIFKDFNIIWSYLEGKKKIFWRNFSLALFTSLLLAVSPYFYGRLVDIVEIQPTDLNFIFILLGAWLFISLISISLNSFTGRRSDFLGVDLYVDLINNSASHLIRLPVAYHKNKKMGEIISRIERAASSLQDIVTDVLFWTVPQFITAFIGIMFLFFIDFRLSFASILFLLFYSFITILKTSKIVKYQKALHKSFDKSYGNLYDSVINVQSVKANTAEEFEDEKIQGSYFKTGIVFKKFMGLWQVLGFWQNIISTLGFIVIFGLALMILNRGEISVGQLVMFVGYFNLIQRPLQGLAWQWRVFKTGVESIKRVNNVLEISAEDYNKKGVVLENFKGKVAFKKVYFKYKGKKNTLEDINFTIMPGQKVALVGASGEGKTTLVDLISLYFKPAKGKIYIDGVDTQKVNLKYLREHIAYVPQEIILFHDTVYNNIKLGNPSASHSQIIEASKSANAHDFISSFPKKYEQLVGERGIKLSAGQKQRIAIARALLRNPRILILDEATSSLDSKTEKLVQEAMEKLFKGRTVLIIAHRLSTIRSVDKIFVLKKKKIIEEGTHEELLGKKGDYFELHSLQNKSNS